jgi:hypothetical protein
MSNPPDDFFDSIGAKPDDEAEGSPEKLRSSPVLWLGATKTTAELEAAYSGKLTIPVITFEDNEGDPNDWGE